MIHHFSVFSQISFDMIDRAEPKPQTNACTHSVIFVGRNVMPGYLLMTKNLTPNSLLTADSTCSKGSARFMHQEVAAERPPPGRMHRDEAPSKSCADGEMKIQKWSSDGLVHCGDQPVSKGALGGAR